MTLLLARATLALMRHSPGALVRLVAWFAVLTFLFLWGAATLEAIESRLRRLEADLGVYVVLDPEAEGLGALQRTIERLPGTRDVTFIVDHTPAVARGEGAPLPLPTLFVRPASSHPESLRSLLSALVRFPSVRDALAPGGLASRVQEAKEALARHFQAAWALACLFAVLSVRVPGAALARVFRREATIAFAMGATAFASAAPAVVVGGLGGAVGAALGATGASLLDVTPASLASPPGWIPVAAGAVLGAAGCYCFVRPGVGGRRPTHLEPGA